MSIPAATSKLKEEGNALYLQKRFQHAYIKYSEAVDSMKTASSDEEKAFVAILYGNKAACCLSLGKYLDAVGDAKKSVDLNPKFSKSWGRLASAYLELGSWKAAIEYYEVALSCLPKSSLNASEITQKKQYDAGIKKAKEMLEPKDEPEWGQPRLSVVNANSEEGRNSPWEKVTKLREEMLRKGLTEKNHKSSVWVFWAACKELERAFELFGQQKVIDLHASVAVKAVDVKSGAFEALSNAILRERRTFRIGDAKFAEQFDYQGLGEIQKVGGWFREGAETVLKEAQQRVKERGWDATRDALSVTVRRWICRAFIQSTTGQEYAANLHYYADALKVLDRGREIWKDVPKRQRGEIFEDYFVVAVRSVYCESYFQAYNIAIGTNFFGRPLKTQTDDPDAAFPIPKLTSAKLLDIAERIIADAPKAERSLDGSRRKDHAFVLSFISYPTAFASAVRGFCYREKAKDVEDYMECMNLLNKALSAYEDAASKFPEDDEYHASHLQYVASVYCSMGAPLHVLLPQIAKLRRAIPLFKPLWSHSSMASAGRDAIFTVCLEHEKRMKEKIRNGELTEDSVCLIGGESLEKAVRKQMGDGAKFDDGGKPDLQEKDLSKLIQSLMAAMGGSS